MGRAPFNVLVLPFFRAGDSIAYCAFERSDMHIWQFIAGGGEADESPLLAAKREAHEEAGLPEHLHYFELQTKTHVPSFCFSAEAQAAWGNTFAIPVHCFAVETPSREIILSDEHTAFRWGSYEEIYDMLHYDVDRTALWELSCILRTQ